MLLSRHEKVVCNGEEKTLVEWAADAPASEKTIIKRVTKVLATEGYTNEELHKAIFDKPMSRGRVVRMGAKASPWGRRNYTNRAGTN